MNSQGAVLRAQIRSLPFLHSGKVRDLFAVGDDKLLVVQTDRLSAFDVVLPSPVPGKGKILTAVSRFWFRRLAHVLPNHLLDIAPESVVAPDERGQVEGRAMVVRKLKPLPIEAIVRGYLAGSGWKEYQRSRSICGIELPDGLREAEKLPAPIFTPSTKAAAGTHDENIAYAEVERLIGPGRAAEVREKAIQLYSEAADYAASRGILIADTKFEFGIDQAGVLYLIDEALTPDSSRFWPSAQYRVGSNPPSFDKQYLRDWLSGLDWNKEPPPPALPQDVVDGTRSRYLEAYERITGQSFDDYLATVGA